MLAVATVALCGLAPSTTSIRPAITARSPAVRCSSSWAAVDAAGTRSATVEALSALKEDGTAKLFGEFKIAPRPVTLRELTQTTKLDEKVLDPSATEFSLEDIQDTFIKVIIGCTVGAIAWAVGSDALGLDAGLRFTVTYLFAGIPIGILAIGSTAPGILFLPVEAFRAATAKEEEKKNRSLRVCRHEASHLLCSYVLGLPVQEIIVDGKGGPRVVVYDEEAVAQPGVTVAADQVNKLAVVALSGLMAEADAYGKAVGASEDLKLLGGILIRSNPPISPQGQQDITRYAALIAWSIIKKYGRAYDAITKALDAGKGLGDCLQAAEEAEAGGAAADAVQAAAKAEAQAKETPQERAARERAEMGWK